MTFVCLERNYPRTTTSETLFARQRNRIQKKANDSKREREREKTRKREKRTEREREREKGIERGASKKGTRRERARRVSDVIRKCLTRLGTTRQVGTTNGERCEERASRRTASGGRSMTSRRVRAGLHRTPVVCSPRCFLSSCL